MHSCDVSIAPVDPLNWREKKRHNYQCSFQALPSHYQPSFQNSLWLRSLITGRFRWQLLFLPGFEIIRKRPAAPRKDCLTSSPSSNTILCFSSTWRTLKEAMVVGFDFVNGLVNTDCCPANYKLSLWTFFFYCSDHIVVSSMVSLVFLLCSEK